jgi:hypothetical protein
MKGVYITLLPPSVCIFPLHSISPLPPPFPTIDNTVWRIYVVSSSNHRHINDDVFQYQKYTWRVILSVQNREKFGMGKVEWKGGGVEQLKLFCLEFSDWRYCLCRHIIVLEETVSFHVTSCRHHKMARWKSWFSDLQEQIDKSQCLDGWMKQVALFSLESTPVVLSWDEVKQYSSRIRFNFWFW